MDKLAEIMAAKQREIDGRIRSVSDKELERFAFAPDHPDSGNFLKAVARPDRLSVIAEIKRRSPSAGDIAGSVKAAEQAVLYAKSGADCLSVLTDEPYFGGTLDDLSEAVATLRSIGATTPCLRKDFMLHPVQVLEAAEAGARAILIIVRALDSDTIRRLYDAAQLAGLDALFEIHEERELEIAIRAGAKIIGVNNRDLRYFKTDIGISEHLIPLIPKEIARVSESGIFTADDAARARACGADAILVGEALMRAEDTASLMAAFHSAGSVAS